MTGKIPKAGDTPLVRGKGLIATEEEENRAIRYINRVKWQFAKSMPETPHSYTVVTWDGGLEGEFRWLATMIQKYSIQELWAAGRYSSYLYIKRHKYWIMSKPKDCILINRTGGREQGSSKQLS